MSDNTQDKCQECGGLWSEPGISYCAMGHATKYNQQSQSYKRGYVAGQERDAYFANLIKGASDYEEAMRGYAEGLASVNEAKQ